MEMPPWPFTSPTCVNGDDECEEQKITAATARLKDESDYRTIVLKIKTPPRYPRVVA